MATLITPLLQPFSQISKASASSSSRITKPLTVSVNSVTFRRYGDSLSSFYRPPCRRLLSRFHIQAAILQDEEEKVIVEESFQPKTFEDNKQIGTNEKSPLEGPTSNSSERWIVKTEQSINIFLTDSVIKILDTLYHDRDYPRFFVLETIARVPYFAFISVLHMYETFGWWRQADYLKVHFAESWNEMHHLLIMEYLMMSFHVDELKNQPAPDVAVKYYTGGDLYLFDEFQTSREPCSRRPVIENLYDVFLNIRDDEAEHCKTMKTCQTHGNLRSPHSSEQDLDESDCVLPQNCEGIVDCIKKSVTSPGTNS